MTRRYWASVGGTLIEEFLLVRRRPDVGQRLADGLIILGGENRLARSAEVDISGKDVIVVQTKDSRLGMYLLGQALFSRMLLDQLFDARSVRSVALCSSDDEVLRPLAESVGIEVVVARDDRP
jgi:hypothetical protein